MSENIPMLVEGSDGPSTISVGAPETAPLLEMTGVSKAFGGVHALRDVDFSLMASRSMAWSARTAPASRR